VDDGNNEVPHESACIIENKMWNQGVDATKRCQIICVDESTIVSRLSTHPFKYAFFGKKI